MAKTAKTDIQPLHDYVLIRPLEEQKKTASGILLPDTAKEKPQAGEVVAVGPGAYDAQGKDMITPMVVKPGQKVLYKKWGGNEIKVDREEWTLIEQKDIMAVVNS